MFAKKTAPWGRRRVEPRTGLCFAYLLFVEEPELPEPLLPVAVLPPPLLVLLPTLPGLAVPPLIDVPALPMPLDPPRLLEPLCPVLP
jgi:hypothetical protein